MVVLNGKDKSVEGNVLSGGGVFFAVSCLTFEASAKEVELRAASGECRCSQLVARFSKLTAIYAPKLHLFSEALAKEKRRSTPLETHNSQLFRTRPASLPPFFPSIFMSCSCLARLHPSKTRARYERARELNRKNPGTATEEVRLNIRVRKYLQ